MSKYIDLVRSTKKLIRRIDANYLVLGRKLRDLLEIFENDTRSFKKFCPERLKISWRKAYYLINAFEVYDQGYVTRTEAISIGWWNLAMIKPRLGKGQDGFWIRLAKRGTAELMGAIRKGKVGKWKRMSFIFDVYEHEAVSNALRTRGALGHAGGLRSKERALLAILQEVEAINARPRARQLVTIAA